MSTLKENLGYVEGTVSISVIVPACFDNPLKKYAEALSRKRQVIIPVSAIIGAYHILQDI